MMHFIQLYLVSLIVGAALPGHPSDWQWWAWMAAYVVTLAMHDFALASGS